MSTSRRVPVTVALWLTLSSLAAQAGGLFLPARGARSLGRGGAIVAGLDDAGALDSNPANLAVPDHFSFVADFALIFQRVGYDRIDYGGNPQPHVDGSTDLLPFPTLSLTWRPRKVPWFTLGVGVWVPYLGLNSYPENGPQRYSMVSLNGSLLAVLQVSGAFRVNKHLLLGIGLQNLFIRFRSLVQLGACPQLNCAPEDPGFDALTQIDASSYFTPSAIVGATVMYPTWRLGVSVQLPFFIRANASVRSRLPTDPFFTNANVVGSSADVAFDLPVIVRAGFELRLIPRFRAELDLTYAAWSMQKELSVTPRGVYIEGVPGIGRYYLQKISLARNLNDTFTASVGVEGEAVVNRVWVRAGYLIETSATPDATMSLLSADGLKNMLSVGIGTRLFGPVRFDLSYAHIFTLDRTVTNSQSLQLNPIQPSLGVPVGNGTYKIDADVLAAGLDARF